MFCFVFYLKFYSIKFHSLKAFETLDPKHTGFLRADDLYNIVTSLNDEKISSEEVAEMLKEADVKGNGVINYRGYFLLSTFFNTIEPSLITANSLIRFFHVFDSASIFS